MSNFHHWQGYLVASNEDCHFICSPWQLDHTCVFGYDSDYTTMAIALIKYVALQTSPVDIKQVDDKISTAMLVAAANLTLADSGFTISCNDDASLTMFLNDQQTIIPPKEELLEIDSIIYNDINRAWDEESNERNISQGAYVSAQQYSESLESRLSLVAQNHNILIWPQRQMDADGTIIGSSNIRMKPTGIVTSWTRLTAAGAPSEFSLRAPILDGIATIMVETTDGPNGVFLLVDDDSKQPKIGASVELVVRRLYAQEGTIRYGLKAILHD